MYWHARILSNSMQICNRSMLLFFRLRGAKMSSSTNWQPPRILFLRLVAHTHTHSRSHLCGMATINGLHLFLLWLYVHGIWMWACVCVRVSCPTIEIIPFEHGIFLLIFLLSFASYILKRTLRERIDFLHLNFFSLVLAEIHSPSCIHTHIQMHPIP